MATKVYKCPLCGGKVEWSKDKTKFGGWECNSCKSYYGPLDEAPFMRAPLDPYPTGEEAPDGD